MIFLEVDKNKKIRVKPTRPQNSEIIEISQLTKLIT